MNIIVLCKQENYTIIDKIQPSVSRTKIKGTLVFNEGGGGGRGTLIFSNKPRLGLFFWVQNFESHYFFFFFFFWGGGVGFRKNIFWGYEDFVDIYWGSSQNWTIFRCHFYVFKRLFLRSSYRMGDIFWAAIILKYF